MGEDLRYKHVHFSHNEFLLCSYNKRLDFSCTRYFKDIIDISYLFLKVYSQGNVHILVCYNYIFNFQYKYRIKVLLSSKSMVSDN